MLLPAFEQNPQNHIDQDFHAQIEGFVNRTDTGVSTEKDIINIFLKQAEGICNVSADVISQVSETISDDEGGGLSMAAVAIISTISVVLAVALVILIGCFLARRGKNTSTVDDNSFGMIANPTHLRFGQGGVDVEAGNWAVRRQGTGLSRTDDGQQIYELGKQVRELQKHILSSSSTDTEESAEVTKLRANIELLKSIIQNPGTLGAEARGLIIDLNLYYMDSELGQRRLINYFPIDSDVRKTGHPDMTMGELISTAGFSTTSGCCIFTISYPSF